MTNSNFIFENHIELVKNLTIAGRPIKDLVDEIRNVYLADKGPG